MTFTNTVSARDVAMRLDPLQFKIQSVYDKLGFEGFDESKGNVKIEDVRAWALMACKSDITNNILILNVLASVKEWRTPEESWRAIIGLSDKTVPLQWLDDNLSQYLRLTFVTMIQFRIENMITHVLDILAKNKVARSYLTNADSLLDTITIANKTDSLKILKLLQNIRNSLHSNGYHSNAELSLKIEDCEFDFRRGQPVKCAGWAHVVIALDATIDVLENILNSPEVRAIPVPLLQHHIEYKARDCNK